MNKTDRFENLAERLVEGTFTRLFAERVSAAKLQMHLEHAIQQHHSCIPAGASQAPTQYWVYVNPEDIEALADGRTTQDVIRQLERSLTEHIQELAAETAPALPSRPTVHVEPNGDVPLRNVRVDARWIAEESTMEQTRQMTCDDVDEAAASLSEGPEGRPFLIIEGERHVNLTEPTVSLGRALDNDIIIEDPRVSRHHAQIRQRYGHMVLYDLDSSGGTSINDYPIEECMLHSGDVISLAGVEIIYGEDPPTPISLPPDEDTPALSKTDAKDVDKPKERQKPGT